MNTFVIKSNEPLLEGKYIGISRIDHQNVFVYRSHEVFKRANRHETEYTIIEKLEDEFDFKKNNICPMCGGLGIWYNLECDQPFNGNILKDEWGFSRFSEEICSYCACDNGTYIGYLEYELKDERNRGNEYYRNYKELQTWVRKTSTCKTCKGAQNATLGLCVCDECGLPGQGYWPG